jgi:hypothetical protein
MNIYSNFKEEIERHNKYKGEDSLSQNYEMELNQNQNIFDIINEHKRKLNEIKNMENIIENNEYSVNNKIKNNDTNKDDINKSIKMAKDYLNYNKSRTSKIYSHLNNSINNNKIINNSFNSNYLNYDTKNDYNYKTLYNYNYAPSNNYISNDYTNINENEKNKQYPSSIKNSFYLKNGDSNFILNNNDIEGRKNNINDNIIYNDKNNEEDNILIASNIKLLRHKLENKENQIKNLESNISYLNNENQSLKLYIDKLESNIQSFKYNNNTISLQNNNIDEFTQKSRNNMLSNDNENNCNNIINEIELKSNIMPSIINKENTNTINDSNIIFNVEKIMNSINYFIRKIYILFNRIFNIKENFQDLNYNQYYELQKHLVKVEKIINKFVAQNIKLDEDDYNNKNNAPLEDRKENEDILNSINSNNNYEPIENRNNKIKVYKMVKKNSNKNLKIKKKKNKGIKSVKELNNRFYKSKSDKKLLHPRKNIGKSKTKNKYN